MHLGMCGSRGRRCGRGTGRVDRGGGWLAARSTGGGEGSAQGGVSTTQGRTPAPPSPCPNHPSPPVATCEMMGERKRVQRPAVCSNIVQTGFQTQRSARRLSLNIPANQCATSSQSDLSFTAPKNAHNPQNFLRVGRLFRPIAGPKAPTTH